MTALVTIKAICQHHRAVEVRIRDDKETFDDFKLSHGQEIQIAISGAMTATISEGAIDGFAIPG